MGTRTGPLLVNTLGKIGKWTGILGGCPPPTFHHVMSSTNVLYSKHTPRPKSSFHLDLGGLTRAWASLSSGLLASAEKRECAPWTVPPPATWTHGIDSNRICGVVQLACRRCTAESSALRLMYARRTMLSVLSLAGVPLVLRSPSSVSSFDLPMLPAGIRIWCTDVWVNRCVESGVRCGNVCRTCLRHSWTQTWCPRPQVNTACADCNGLDSNFNSGRPIAHRVVDAFTGCAALGGMAAMVKFAGEMRPESVTVSAVLCLRNGACCPPCLPFLGRR